MARIIFALINYSVPRYLRKKILMSFGADRIVYIRPPFIKSDASTEEKIRIFEEYIDSRVRKDDVLVALLVSRAPLITMLSAIYCIKRGIPLVITHNTASKPDEVELKIAKREFTYTVFTPDMITPRAVSRVYEATA